MTKTFAMCRIDGLIELREEHPGEGYFALAVGDLASVRAAVFATAEPHQVGKKVARRVPGVSPDATDRENLGSIARHIQTWASRIGPASVRWGVKCSSPTFNHPGQSYGAVDVDSRLRAVAGFDLEQCRAALAVTGLQKIVEQKIRTRIRQLEKQASAQKEA
ncbi:hypothetical protein [Pseudomonas aeruginosa]|uniref:hypothetical protein n=1 Tax=Pseudomonas aeruginosa TaxID=287 RepID=UPI001F5B30C0|nr:hypothetical protein [Pseudomonas aeruginosa]UIO45573.1 hypothetical protein K5A80_36420 [Pseudomonas aeruginosa]